MSNGEFIDIDLSITKRKKIRVDGDDTRILELNTSDMGIIGRLTEASPKLQELQEKAQSVISGTDTAESEDELLVSCKTMAEKLKIIDDGMRDILDYIFDAPVSAVTCPTGSMYDLFDGVFRYEHIITAIMALYEDNLKVEYKKVETNIKKFTNKYKKG